MEGMAGAVFSAKGVVFIFSLGQRLRIRKTHKRQHWKRDSCLASVRYRNTIGAHMFQEEEYC